MVAVGTYYAGAQHRPSGRRIRRHRRGAGDRQEEHRQPIEYAIPKVHRFLEKEGIREDVTLIASGGMSTAMDVAKAIAWARTASSSAPRRWWRWDASAAPTARAGAAARAASRPRTRSWSMLNEIPIQAKQAVPTCTAPGRCSGRSCCYRLDMKDIRRAQGQDGPAPLRGNTQGGCCHETTPTRLLRFEKEAHAGPVQIPARRRPRADAGWSGLAASQPVDGCSHTAPLEQMHNRGNGKGGGISAVGLVPGAAGRGQEDAGAATTWSRSPTSRTRCREELEKEFIHRRYDVHSTHRVPISDDPALLGKIGGDAANGGTATSAGPRRRSWTASSMENELQRHRPEAGGGRVRLSDQLQDQPEVLRRQRRCPPSSCPRAGTC